MLEMQKELKQLLEPFEQAAQCFTESEVSSTLVTFLTEHPDRRDTLKKFFAPEIIAFSLYALRVDK